MFVIFLDRDGTINELELEEYVLGDVEIRLVPGAVTGMKKLQELGAVLNIVTNQTGIGEGLYNEKAMHVYNKNLLARLKEDEIEIAAVAYCPHARDAGCECRKPGPGMLKELEGKLGKVDWEKAWMIGDKLADPKTILPFGGRAVLLTSQYWSKEDEEAQELLQNERVFVAENLKEAASIIEENLS